MFSTIITSRKQLYKYLDNLNFEKYSETPLSSVYLLINNKGKIEPIYFMHYEDVYFESPCCLMQTMPEEDVEEYVKEYYETDYIEEAIAYEKGMCRNGYHYEIECPQCSPFLSETFEIIAVLTESECLDWLINKEKELEER